MINYYVEILLNREEDEEGRLQIFSRLRSEDTYQPGDRLEQVWSGKVKADESEHDVLNIVFEMFNRGAPGFIGDKEYPQRSTYRSVSSIWAPDGRLMKVKIVVEVEVDREAWAHEFYLDNTDKAVRADVKQYFDVTVKEQLTRLGLGATSEPWDQNDPNYHQ